MWLHLADFLSGFEPTNKKGRISDPIIADASIPPRIMIPNDFRLLAEEVAGPKHQGKLRGKVGWHRSQTGVVSSTLETILG